MQAATTPRKGKLTLISNALPSTLKSATNEVPLKQLFSQANKLVPATTMKYGVLHV